MYSKKSKYSEYAKYQKYKSKYLELQKRISQSGQFGRGIPFSIKIDQNIKNFIDSREDLQILQKVFTRSDIPYDIDTDNEVAIKLLELCKENPSWDIREGTRRILNNEIHKLTWQQATYALSLPNPGPVSGPGSGSKSVPGLTPISETSDDEWASSDDELEHDRKMFFAVIEKETDTASDYLDTNYRLLSFHSNPHDAWDRRNKAEAKHKHPRPYDRYTKYSFVIYRIINMPPVGSTKVYAFVNDKTQTIEFSKTESLDRVHTDDRMNYNIVNSCLDGSTNILNMIKNSGLYDDIFL